MAVGIFDTGFAFCLRKPGECCKVLRPGCRHCPHCDLFCDKIAAVLRRHLGESLGMLEDLLVAP